MEPRTVPETDSLCSHDAMITWSGAAWGAHQKTEALAPERDP